MKKLPLLFTLVLFIIAPFARAGTGDVRLIVVNADGTYSESAVAATPGNVLAFGTGGTVTSVTPVTASSIPAIRAGNVTVTGLATKAVTFSTPFPSGMTYVVQVVTNGLATSGYASAMTVSGFTLTLPLAVTGTISYIATPVQ